MSSSSHIRILSLAPSTGGFGFAVIERGALINWGTKTAKGRYKNVEALAKAKALIVRYRPDIVVLENTSAKQSRHGIRIRTLTNQICKAAKKEKVRVKLVTRANMMKSYFPEGKGTNQGIAELMAQRFPQELKDRLPPKRRAWNSETARMHMFIAVALALMCVPRPTLQSSAAE